MTRVTVETLYQVIEATWPTAAKTTVGPWTIRRGEGGGSRVSAATAQAPFSDADIPLAEAAMTALGQDRIFMIGEGDDALDRTLAARGYEIKDPVNLYAAPLSAIAAPDAPRHMTFRAWPPLAIQTELWSEAHIGPARIAVMARANCPKTTLFARCGQAPAGNVYIGIHDRIAMFHALEVSPDHRRKGVAQALIRAAVAWATESGAEQMALVVTQANAGANRLYASMGFTLVGQYHYRIAKG